MFVVLRVQGWVGVGGGGWGDAAAVSECPHAGTGTVLLSVKETQVNGATCVSKVAFLKLRFGRFLNKKESPWEENHVGCRQGLRGPECFSKSSFTFVGGFVSEPRGQMLESEDPLKKKSP